MSGRMFTTHQRDILMRRLERALLWDAVTEAEQFRARRRASVVMDELELSGFSAAAQRRAISNIADRLERTA